MIKRDEFLKYLKILFKKNDEFDCPYHEIYEHELNNIADEVLIHQRLFNKKELVTILKYNILMCFDDTLGFSDQDYYNVVHYAIQYSRD